MKYRRLSNEELQALEKEFVNYLAAAQITANDWENMKQQDIAQAQELIDVFSDMVYEKALSNITFLEYRDKKIVNIFKCEEEYIRMIGLRISETSGIDLTVNEIYSEWNKSQNGTVSIVKYEKKYNKERSIEVFELLQNGCLITDDTLFNLLKGMVTEG